MHMANRLHAPDQQLCCRPGLQSGSAAGCLHAASAVSLLALALYDKPVLQHQVHRELIPRGVYTRFVRTHTRVSVRFQSPDYLFPSAYFVTASLCFACL